MMFKKLRHPVRRRATLAVLASALVSTLGLGIGTVAHAQTPLAPDALVRQISTEVIDTVKADKDIQAGNLGKIIALVDAKVMPHVNFQRMTAIAVGRAWRSATPEQQKRLLDEFKTLLVRTYSGALTQAKLSGLASPLGRWANCQWWLSVMDVSWFQSVAMGVSVCPGGLRAT
jgi:hypothetical protein